MAGSTNNPEKPRYPMLEAILAIRNLPIQPMYTTRSIAEIFEVSVRAIQNWIAVGQLTARDLPGRWRFLTQDVEDFLQASQKGAR